MLSPSQRLFAALGLVGILSALGFALFIAFDTGTSPRPQQLFPPSAAGVSLHSGMGLRPKVALGPKTPIFPKQPDPQLALMLSGQVYGYLQPCGCARPQTGGLERRFELLRQLRARGWTVSPADLGDLAPKHAGEQGRIKYETAMQTLQDMGYPAVGLGLTELRMPLEQALGLAQNFQPPHVLAANLNDKDVRFPEMFRGWTVHDPGAAAWVGSCVGELSRAALGGSPAPAISRPSLRVGYVGLVGDGIAKKAKDLDATLIFDPIGEALTKAMEELSANQPDVRVLLFQGSKEEARMLIAEHPAFDVVLARDDSDEPPSLPERVGGTLLITVGHKGKYVGLVGVFPRQEVETNDEPHVLRRSASGFELHYQLVAMTEHYELPDLDSSLARERMKDYVERVRQGDFLAKAPRSLHPLQVEFPEARFAGSGACKECHRNAWAVWSESKHSHAYENLAKYGRPLGRQFDPECASCHTTGFQHRTGFVDEKLTPHLFGNGCENCHGPASLHVANPREPRYVTPLRRSIASIENTCRTCHDGDNDPHFNLDRYWPLIRHRKD